MQLVSLDDLKKLLPSSSSSNVDESSKDLIAPNLSFDAICKTYGKCRNEIKKTTNIDIRPKLYQWMNDNCLSKKSPPIELIGQGSSRTAYVCLGGKCIKLAINEAGIAQNIQEWKSTKKHWWRSSFSCFAQSYGKNDDFALMLSECCAKIEEPRQLANAIVGSDDINVLKAVIKVICDDKHCDINSASTQLKQMAPHLSDAYANAANAGSKWLDHLSSANIKQMTPGQRSFMQLVKFWKKNGIDELMPGDVYAYENWGFAIRDGQITPVMLDVGLSKKIAKKFY